MKNKFVLFFLLFVAGITLLFFLLNRQLEADYDLRKRTTVDQEKSFNRMNEYLNETLAHTSIQDIMIEDTQSKACFLSDLVSQSPALVFRYSELNCNTCYKAELLSLQNIFAQEERQIAILSSYSDSDHFIMYKDDNQIELPFYRISQDAFDWILEDYGSPYYFVLHPDLTVSHIFVPDRTFPRLNKEYVEKVKQFLYD